MKKVALFLSVFFALCAGISAHAQENSAALDARAKKHYTEEQISSMSPAKIAQVNFYYSRSFIILKKDACTSCPAIDVNTLDISEFDNQRADDRRVVVFLTRPGHAIELLSWNELKAEYAKLSAGK